MSAFVLPPARDYYGQPVLHRPVWKTADIGGYLFTGGVAAGSSLLAAGASLRGLPCLARRSKAAAAAAAALSLAGLVHDLGRRRRFLNMLRVFKPTSPMSVGSWVLAAYAPAAFTSAGCALSGRWKGLGAAATAGAAAFAPALASYTGVLLADTAVPAWHDAGDDLPMAFVGSSALASGGLALLTTPLAEAAPARSFAVAGALTELVALHHAEARMGDVGRAYSVGAPGALMRAGKWLATAGAAGALVSRRRWQSALSGAALVTASACTRLGVFKAGSASADDPQATIAPQRARRPPASPPPAF